MGNGAPGHSTIQHCSLYVFGFCVNNSARLPIYVEVLPFSTCLPHFSSADRHKHATISSIQTIAMSSHTLADMGPVTCAYAGSV